MKYAILGAGALGSVVGGLMARDGVDVVLWDINDAHLDAINNNGLRLDLPHGSETVQIPACRPDQGGGADAIILLTKTLHTSVALGGVTDLIAAGTPVLSLQNGLGNARRVADKVPEDQVFYGCTMMPGRFIAPGHVASQGDGKAVFRALTDAGASTGSAIACNTPGFSLIHDQAEADTLIWQKAAFNCAMNAICALAGGRVEYLSNSQTGIKLARDVAEEAINVAKAKGIAADLDAVFAQMDRALANHQAHKPSMLQDMEAGCATEIDALCGEVAYQGKAVGLSTPINHALEALIRLKTDVLKGEAE